MSGKKRFTPVYYLELLWTMVLRQQQKRCQLAIRLDSLLRVASLPLLQAWDPELEQHISSIFHGQYLRLAHRRRTILPHLAQTSVKKTSDLPFSFLFLFLALLITLLFLHFFLLPQIVPKTFAFLGTSVTMFPNFAGPCDFEAPLNY